MLKNKKIIFIDRDGVINKDPGGWTKYNYVTKWKDFHFLPGSKKAIRLLNDNGYDIVVISNQAGVSKGYYSAEKLRSINKKMLDKIKKAGGRIKNAYYCIHQDSDGCDCRKPNIGLFKKAQFELGASARGSYFIGDGQTDVEAGSNAALKTVLVLSGKTDLKDVKKWKDKPDFIFKNLLEAVLFILQKRRER